MSAGLLFLKIKSSGIITFTELDWITLHQFRFNRLEESVAIQIGRLIDSGIVNIGCRLPV